MDVKEAQRQFRLGAWPSASAIDAFAMSVEPLPASETSKMLALLIDRNMMIDIAGHRNRLYAFRRLVERSPDPQLFVPFAKALKPADLGTRAVLVELLPKVNLVSGHPELVNLLKQPDAGLRRAVVQALKAMPGKSVFDLCAASVRDDHAGRADAMELAATIGAYHAIPSLEYALINGRPADRLVALKYLGDVRLVGKDVPAALAAIAKVLSDPNESIAVAAIAAFGALCTEEDFHVRLGPIMDGPGTVLPRAVVEIARRFPSPRTFAAIERRFRVGPNALRLAVINTVEAIGSDETLPLLTEALAVRHLPVRTRAGEALSNLAINSKVNLARTLLWLLRSHDVNVRRIAVDIAKKVGDPKGELWPSLMRFLRDEDWWVRERVMDALVEMAGVQLTRHIVGYLQDPSDVVRRFAVDVLMRLKDPQSLGALVRCAMADTDWWVRERAIEASALLGDPRAVPYILQLMTTVEELQITCLYALGTLRATTTAPAVLALLGSQDIDTRRAALACLAQIGSPEHAPYVEPAMSDADHRVRAQARGILNQWNISASAGLSSGVYKATLSPLDRLLVQMARAEGDDLILAANRVPFVKKLGRVMPLDGMPVLSPESVRDLLLGHLNEVQRAALNNLQDVDFSYEVKTESLRFRANLFMQQTGLAAVFRIVKDKLLSIEDLGLPSVVQKFGEMKNGLVLVGGPTGSGKSTTLAAIIDYINRTSARHIISLEDPIEVLHRRKSSLVNQREVGTHTRSFTSALRSVLREDPDVLLVGEMRDLATISFAVTAAETGHLVFGTLHTVSADTTMDRLINAFPSGQQAQVRSMLADSIQAVVCQHLLRRIDKPGRAAAVEVMLRNDAIANLIRKGKCFQIPSIIATGREQGMQTMDWDLKRLVRQGIISADEAYMKANSKKEFEDIINGKDSGVSAPPAGAAPTVPSMSPVASVPPAQVRPAITSGTVAPVTQPGTRSNVPRVAPR